MKKLLVILCVLVAPLIAPLIAQDQQPKPTLTDYERGVPVIIQQRNQLSATLLDAQAQIQMLAAEVDSLKKQVAELSAKLANADKPKSDAAKVAASPEQKPIPKS